MHDGLNGWTYLADYCYYYYEVGAVAVGWLLLQAVWWWVQSLDLHEQY